jgi:hypothetical protein
MSSRSCTNSARPSRVPQPRPDRPPSSTTRHSGTPSSSAGPLPLPHRSKRQRLVASHPVSLAAGTLPGCPRRQMGQRVIYTWLTPPTSNCFQDRTADCRTLRVENDGDSAWQVCWKAQLRPKRFGNPVPNPMVGLHVSVVLQGTHLGYHPVFVRWKPRRHKA